MTQSLFTLDLEDLSGTERTIRFAADEADREVIAERLDLQAVARFELGGVIRRLGSKGDAILTGTVSADVTQTCVVTLDPIEATASADIHVRLIHAGSMEFGRDVEIDLDDEDVELIEGDTVDLGDIAVQYLAMSLDPYPRKPVSLAEAAKLGLADAAEVEAESDVSGRKNPFAVLQQLKDKA